MISDTAAAAAAAGPSLDIQDNEEGEHEYGSGDDSVTFQPISSFIRNGSVFLEDADIADDTSDTHSLDAQQVKGNQLGGVTAGAGRCAVVGRDGVARVLRDPADPVGKTLRELGVLPSDPAAALLLRDLSQAPHKVRDKYGKRREESVAQRVESSRARNKEHARATRQRRRLLEAVLRAHVARMQDSLYTAVLLPLSQGPRSSFRAKARSRESIVKAAFSSASFDAKERGPSNYPMQLEVFIWSANRAAPPQHLAWAEGEAEAHPWSACIRHMQRLVDSSCGMSFPATKIPTLVAIQCIGDALSISQGNYAVAKFGLILEYEGTRYCLANESMFANFEFATSCAEAEFIRIATLYFDTSQFSDALSQLNKRDEC